MTLSNISLNLKLPSPSNDIFSLDYTCKFLKELSQLRIMAILKLSHRKYCEDHCVRNQSSLRDLAPIFGTGLKLLLDLGASVVFQRLTTGFIIVLRNNNCYGGVFRVHA